MRTSNGQLVNDVNYNTICKNRIDQTANDDAKGFVVLLVVFPFSL